jgi:hypothetical protein
MKNAKQKSATGANRKVAAGKGKRKAKNLSELREQITDMVTGEAVGLVKTTIEEADKGHFAAMKYLFEMIGLYPAPGAEEPEADDTLAKTLIRRLQLPEEPIPQNSVTKDWEVDALVPEATGPDTVE